jgi:hypothetical protein
VIWLAGRALPLERKDGRSAAARLDRLHEVSETYRNTYGHGGFDKEGGSIYFHVPDVGALPARLTDVRDSPHFDVIPVGSLDFEELCCSQATGGNACQRFWLVLAPIGDSRFALIATGCHALLHNCSTRNRRRNRSCPPLC